MPRANHATHERYTSFWELQGAHGCAHRGEGRLLDEQAADERAVRCDAGAGGNLGGCRVRVRVRVRVRPHSLAAIAPALPCSHGRPAAQQLGWKGAAAHHDQVGVRVLLREEHDLAGGAGQLDLVTGLGVAQEVRADALLGGVVGLQLRAPG